MASWNALHKLLVHVQNTPLHAHACTHTHTHTGKPCHSLDRPGHTHQTRGQYHRGYCAVRARTCSQPQVRRCDVQPGRSSWCVCVYVCVLERVRMHVRLYACLFVCRSCLCDCVCVCLSMCVSVYVPACLCLCACLCVQSRICARVLCIPFQWFLCRCTGPA